MDAVTDTSGTEDPGGESPGAAGTGDDGDVMDHAPEPAPEPSIPPTVLNVSAADIAGIQSVPVTDQTSSAPGEKVTARVMVAAMWGDRAGRKILHRDDLVVVDADDRRLGKTLAVVEDEAADPGVAATLAALADG